MIKSSQQELRQPFLCFVSSVLVLVCEDREKRKQQIRVESPGINLPLKPREPAAHGRVCRVKTVETQAWLDGRHCKAPGGR